MFVTNFFAIVNIIQILRRTALWERGEIGPCSENQRFRGLEVSLFPHVQQYKLIILFIRKCGGLRGKTHRVKQAVLCGIMFI